jgi:ATP-binding cassette subfamily B protein
MQGAATEHGKAFDWEVSKRILGYLRPYKRNVWIAVAGMMISVLSTIAGPPLIGYAVDHGLQENDLGVAVGAAVAYMLTQVAGFSDGHRGPVHD